MTSENAKRFFENYLGKKSSEFVTLAQSGSARINFLAKADGTSYIITSNTNLQENESFLYYSEVFSSLGLNTPKIIAVSEDRTTYIQEFLGSRTLSEVIAAQGLSSEVKALVKQSLKKLFRLQNLTLEKIDFTRTFEYESYDELPVIHDLYYFKNFIADVLELEYHKSTLLKEFKAIAVLIEALQPQGLMIRDFQSRNIMVNDRNEVSFIDYQSAMKGPLMYDVISFLFQAKANFPEVFKAEMLDFYIEQSDNEDIRIQLKNSVEPLKMMRFLQVLGAYGFRGLIQRKPHFISSLEKGVSNISDLASTWTGMKDFPELSRVIQQLTTDETRSKINTILNTLPRNKE
ncbi:MULTISPECIES: aminoglycoside phosphotransferase family protein [Chryseobacterium]|uniref:Aminoglycoside/choline kinase family phosphotransferase n=1 Tax=Chryseobacterium camelliae TaxID=1265445 RepID=A0ABU0TNC3_9FLAO|nr:MULTISPECIES: phosphotransferase [Chryseobacterium]MDT3407667.1 aminoglycoside/choline kinase family phosphotransferase [Pseudacidovorax intermedius]MDQ1098481.1 aminoglycoside/choline kinase family phosphotransferase [Chryseobacterium camelliae]MDQ1102404.1 aminoglycoside/choline kinase family phosphotransferase [Chryseobacterium sp. SORGH_AS_1048]MDR6085841.1 aminoglycoside/choline kinase family phosphotransferase [Chryseobacterium sp. SORGH_AS_0909]MDR6130205.1 aminoglycoside/choline kin